ncbi:hypothetical protein [Streptomyces sp. RKAG337]|nr:hypothetical protein [Streptomyces sp. RKAG337]
MGNFSPITQLWLGVGGALPFRNRKMPPCPAAGAADRGGIR